MTGRNFNEIREILLHASTRVTPSTDERERVVQRASSKTAPFHRNRKSVADALLIEMYSTAIAAAGDGDQYGFVTSNSEDFSAVGGHNRQPHNDLAGLFAAENSTSHLGVEGLEQALMGEFGDSLQHIIGEGAWSPTKEPRLLDEILAVEGSNSIGFGTTAQYATRRSYSTRVTTTVSGSCAGWPVLVAPVL